MTSETPRASIVDDPAIFVGLIATGQRLIGIDGGTKTFGLAVSDVRQTIATPLKTVMRGKFTRDATELRDVIEELSATGVVLGLPRNLDGSDGPRVQATRALARNLLKIIAVPILLWDERLTTALAERVLLEADQSRKRRAEVIDKVAAALILQSALDRFRMLREKP